MPSAATLPTDVQTPPVDPPVGLVAVDLDGTLLDDRKQVGPRTAAAVTALSARGVPVVIASARPPRSVRHVYQQLRLDAWQINYNGALIWDEPAGRAVFHRPMPHELVASVVDLARGAHADCLVSCEVCDKWYTDRADHAYTTETGRLFGPDVVAPLPQFLTQPITKLMLLGPVPMMDALAVLVRAAFPQVAVVRSDPDLLQIMDATVNKGTAVRRAAEAYGVPMDRVMAIGDAANDIEMLQAVGVAVAVGNAWPEVKQVADWVAPSNNDDGVYAALAKYGLAE